MTRITILERSGIVKKKYRNWLVNIAVEPAWIYRSFLAYPVLLYDDEKEESKES